jgi:uncharacterized phage-associated protein
MKLQRLFTAHPQSVDETYRQHLMRAARFGGRMVFAGLACMTHALLPFIFVRTGSEAITELNEQMVSLKQAAAQRAAASKT